MRIDALKTRVAEYRESLAEKKGHMVSSTDNGPIGMDLIDDLVRVLESQEMRIAELEKKLAKGGGSISGG
jgi:hypothetical protein